MDKRGFSPERRELVFALSLLFLGAALRLLGLGFFPPGLNQDEASTGCDAWGLLVSGMDRNGDGWPVLFTSWGSGQNALYAYVLLPLMALLPTGLTHGIYASLENSFFSGELFRNNMIAGFIHNIFI